MSGRFSSDHAWLRMISSRASGVLALAARLKRRHIGAALRDIVWVDSHGSVERIPPPVDNSTNSATNKSLPHFERRRPAPEIMSLLLQLGDEDPVGLLATETGIHDEDGLLQEERQRT